MWSVCPLYLIEGSFFNFHNYCNAAHTMQKIMYDGKWHFSGECRNCSRLSQEECVFGKEHNIGSTSTNCCSGLGPSLWAVQGMTNNWQYKLVHFSVLILNILFVYHLCGLDFRVRLSVLFVTFLATLHPAHRCCLLLHISHASAICLSVIVCLGHTGEPCKKGWTDLDSALGVRHVRTQATLPWGCTVGATWWMWLTHPYATAMRLHIT